MCDRMKCGIVIDVGQSPCLWRPGGWGRMAKRNIQTCVRLVSRRKAKIKPHVVSQSQRRTYHRLDLESSRRWSAGDSMK